MSCINSEVAGLFQMQEIASCKQSHALSHTHTSLNTSQFMPSLSWVGVVVTLLPPCFISWTDGPGNEVASLHTHIHKTTHTPYTQLHSSAKHSVDEFCPRVTPQVSKS